MEDDQPIDVNTKPRLLFSDEEPNVHSRRLQIKDEHEVSSLTFYSSQDLSEDLGENKRHDNRDDFERRQGELEIQLQSQEKTLFVEKTLFCLNFKPVSVEARSSMAKHLKIEPRTVNDLKLVENGCQQNHTDLPCDTRVGEDPFCIKTLRAKADADSSINCTRRYEETAGTETQQSKYSGANLFDQRLSSQSQRSSVSDNTTLVKCESAEDTAQSALQQTKSQQNQMNSLIIDKQMAQSQMYRFTCDMCNQKFWWMCHVVRHMIQHSSLKPFTCDVCHKGFKVREGLKAHRFVHLTERPFICQLCNVAFKSKVHLRSHFKVIHSSVNPYKRFKCDMCNRRFQCISQLERHIYTHSSVKPFICDVCKRMFTQMSFLVRHKNIHSSVKLITCDMCNKGLNSLTPLSQHILTHLALKPFTCDVCSKGFTSSSDFRKHKYTHSSLKLFRCDVCDKSFKQKSTLIIHKKTHSSLKPYTCDVCNMCFREKSTLKTHEFVRT